MRITDITEHHTFTLGVINSFYQRQLRLELCHCLLKVAQSHIIFAQTAEGIAFAGYVAHFLGKQCMFAVIFYRTVQIATLNSEISCSCCPTHTTRSK